MRVMLAAAAVIVAVLAGAAIYLTTETPEGYTSPALVASAGGDIGGPFTLTAQTGEVVTERDVIDGPTLVYFGYTFCPDVCPIDVQVMTDAVDILSDETIAVKPVFVTIDPARDTVDALADYASNMHPRLLALTGSDAEIEAVATAYKVYYQRVDAEDSAAGYLMNHSAFMYLMTPEDGLVGLFRHGFGPEQIAADIAALLKDS